MRIRVYAVAALATALLAGCTGAPTDTPTVSASGVAGFPVSVTACGHTTTVTAAPQRAVTLNQGATEVALALGVQHQLVGTAYLDDSIAPQWQQAYAAIPVLSAEYPTNEQILSTKPDLLYASYSSAFSDKAVGTQHELAGRHIASYLSPLGCANAKSATTWDSIWGEISDVAKLFGVPERANSIRTQQQQELSQVRGSGTGKSVLWYDSETKAPFVGAGEGGPQLILNAVGARNIFADLSGGWKDSSWEAVLAADPDVIVLADASWSTAAAKLAYLRGDPVLKNLRAVRNNAIIEVPFGESTPGVRLADGARAVAAGLAKLQ